MEQQRTVRELGGEIWAEITELQNSTENSPFDDVHWETVDKLCNLIMGVLARHTGKEIINDGDLPVTPLD